MHHFMDKLFKENLGFIFNSILFQQKKNTINYNNNNT